MLSRPINVVVDSHIPYLEGVLEPLGDVRVLAPEKITAEAVADADILLIRTRTKVGQALLGDNPRCSFAGTCTIGLDHIDAAYCREHGITAVNAPGCNAPAVAQYVFSAIARLINRPVDQYVLGIVGVGNIGKLVQKWAEGLGMRVMLCDPPRQRAEGGDGWCSLDDIAREADIVTFHTPLTREGDDATFHLADSKFFNKLRRAPVFINAARGPVTDNNALKEAIKSGQVSHAVIDVWEGEPNIDKELLDLVAIGTPHIAGYSSSGKVRATTMVLDSLARHLGPELMQETYGSDRFTVPAPEPPAIPAIVRLPQVARSYDIMVDDATLRREYTNFENLRDYYPLRPEAPGKPKVD